MELLYIVIGMWLGMITTFVQWYRPMNKKIKDLEEGMKKCVKDELTNNIEDDK